MKRPWFLDRRRLLALLGGIAALLALPRRRRIPEKPFHASDLEKTHGLAG